MSSNNSGRIGTLGLLGVAFVTLKLTNVINWSWWWVTAPFWGGAALVLAICGLVAFFGVLTVVIAHFLDKHRRFKRAKAWDIQRNA